MARTSPVGILRRIPFTAALVAVIVGAAVRTGTTLGPIDPALRRLIGFAAIHLPAMEWHRILRSLVRTPGGWAFYASAVQLALFVGSAEWIHGTRKAAAAFLGVHVVSPLVVAFGLAFPLASVGVVMVFLAARLAWSFVNVPDAGREIAADTAHFVATPLGYVAARIARTPPSGGSQASSRPHDAGSCR